MINPNAYRRFSGSKPFGGRLLLAVIVWTMIGSLAWSFPSFVMTLFCAPSAWLSGQFLGALMVPVADGFRLANPTLTLDVTLACSGTSFFGILSALMIFRSQAPLRLFSLLPPVGWAYFITLLANTARIVIGGYAARWAQAALPPSLHPGVHLATGIVVFSSFLVVSLVLTQWRTTHATSPHAAPLAF